MKIDKAIAKFKEITNTDANCPGHCNLSCDQCVQESRQLVEWLEELKEYKTVYKTNFSDGYNTAIDDFVQLVKKYDWNIRNRNVNAFIYGAIDKIAEILKGEKQ